MKKIVETLRKDIEDLKMESTELKEENEQLKLDIESNEKEFGDMYYDIHAQNVKLQERI